MGVICDLRKSQGEVTDFDTGRWNPYYDIVIVWTATSDDDDDLCCHTHTHTIISHFLYTQEAVMLVV
jgi:hypothetical protein